MVDHARTLVKNRFDKHLTIVRYRAACPLAHLATNSGFKQSRPLHLYRVNHVPNEISSELSALSEGQNDAMSEGPAAKTKWVLVINHERTIRDVLEQFLCVDGHFVLTAAECAEGLDKARLMPVSLVVLDVDLPMSNGMTIRDRFKSEAFTARLPLLLISSRLPKHELHKMAAGTDGFLTMPFTFLEVRESVNRLLERADEPAPAARLKPPSGD